MPRYSGVLASLFLVIICVGFNINRYPAVSEMLKGISVDVVRADSTAVGQTDHADDGDAVDASYRSYASTSPSYTGSLATSRKPIPSASSSSDKEYSDHGKNDHGKADGYEAVDDYTTGDNRKKDEKYSSNYPSDQDDDYDRYGDADESSYDSASSENTSTSETALKSTASKVTASQGTSSQNTLSSNSKNGYNLFQHDDPAADLPTGLPANSADKSSDDTSNSSVAFKPSRDMASNIASSNTENSTDQSKHETIASVLKQDAEAKATSVTIPEATTGENKVTVPRFQPTDSPRSGYGFPVTPSNDRKQDAFRTGDVLPGYASEYHSPKDASQGTAALPLTSQEKYELKKDKPFALQSDTKTNTRDGSGYIPPAMLPVTESNESGGFVMPTSNSGTVLTLVIPIEESAE